MPPFALSAAPSPRDDGSWLGGDGEIVELIRSRDWSQTPLGPIERWPESLRTTVSLALSSSFPINIIWGPGAVQIWNAAYSTLCGEKHPSAFGSDFRECWKSAWPAVGEAFASASAGRTAYLEDEQMFIDRNGDLEETSFTFSLSPIRDEAGTVVGLFHPVTETTARTLAGRRTQALRDLASRVSQAHDPREAAAVSFEVLAGCQADLPFALLYETDAGTGHAVLVARTGIDEGLPISPRSIDRASGSPLASALAGGVAARLDLDELCGELHAGPYDEPIREALAVPVGFRGLLVAGISTRLPLDSAYRVFVELVAQSIAAALSAAGAYERERERAEALAQIDRAKTVFFSNLSHEFRTPLTLMLGPLEDELAEPGLEPHRRERLATAHRNSLRLLRLVNALLEFARLQDGRVTATYRPTDLAGYTANLCGLFRSATERAGLELEVHCPPLPEPAFVDCEMWERIVTNLLSNAFKHTFDGVIAVGLHARGSAIELVVSDSGVGIPAAELPRLFERFHRGEDARSRSAEGSGIGLSLVRELAGLHGGAVTIDSEENRGTRVTVTIPRGAAHLPAERVFGEAGPGAAPARDAGSLVDTILGWLDEPAIAFDPAPAGGEGRGRVLVAEDNADMRAHIARLLGQRFDVVAVADGATALELALADPPDLVLTDVMMPGLDGFALTAALRGDERTAGVPVIMLSARAGEEPSAEGIAAGADDYLVKPFSARELVARVSGTVDLSRKRQESARRLEQINDELTLAARIKSEFVTNVSHEIRTPMNALVGMTGLLAGTALDERQRECVETIRLSGEHLLAIIDDILDLAKLDAGRMELEPHAFDPRRTCAEAVDVVAVAAAAKGLKTAVRVDRDVPHRVIGDARRVRQILVNLLSNAVKFTPGGEVALTVGAAPVDAAGRSTVSFTVSDTGVGIAPAKLDRLFQPFTQLDESATRSHGGTGLGLAISRALAELMGARLAVRSAVGEGSTFTLELPLPVAPPAPRADRAAAAPCTAPTAAGLDPGLAARADRRVLVVDDNALNQKVAVRMLEFCGFAPDTAANGVEAVAALERETYDVVFMDIQMPEMDGLQATREIRRRVPSARQPHIAGITAGASGEDRDDCVRAGMDDLLTKPFRAEDLVRAIERSRRR